MTKSELIRALEGVDDSVEVYLGMQGVESPFWIDEVNIQKGKPVLRPADAPEFEDICKMADACYEEWGSGLKDCELGALANVSDKAERAYMKSLVRRYSG